MLNKTVLENGLRIVSERLEHFRSVSLGIWVNVGSRDEEERENGVSHFIEHMIFKGTATRSSLRIAKELDAIGGLSNAFTGMEYTCFHSRVLDKHLHALADILSDIFLHSLFDPQDMNRERQVILQEINMLEDMPDEQIHVLFSNLFWMNHPLGMPVMGTPQSVSAITKETVLSHIRRFYTPGRIIVAAAGNVDHESLVRYLRPLFESLPKEKAAPARTAPRTHTGVSCRYKELEQVHLCLGGAAPHLSSELRFAGAVLNTILGGNMSSRMFMSVREEKGLCYYVRTSTDNYTDIGAITTSAGVDNTRVDMAIEAIMLEYKKIQEEEVGEAELKKAKEFMKGKIILRLEDSEEYAHMMGKQALLYPDVKSVDEILK